MATYHLSMNLSPRTFLVFMENHGFENFSPHTFLLFIGKSTHCTANAAHGWVVADRHATGACLSATMQHLDFQSLRRPLVTRKFLRTPQEGGCCRGGSRIPLVEKIKRLSSFSWKENSMVQVPLIEITNFRCQFWAIHYA